MLDAVRRYITRVLILHLALLIVLISFVVMAARQVQVGAREQVQEETKRGSQLYADLSAAGVESIYDPIIQNLDVYLREGPTTAPATAPADAWAKSPG